MPRASAYRFTVRAALAALVAALLLGLVGSAPATAHAAQRPTAAASKQAKARVARLTRACARARRLAPRSRAAARAARVICKKKRAAVLRLPVAATPPSPNVTPPGAALPGGGSAARGPRGFEVGLVNSSWHDPKVLASLGAPIARVEFRVGTSVEQMRPAFATFAAAGTRILPLAGFKGTLPTVAEATQLREWALEFGPGGRFWVGRADGHLAISDIEFGNETNATYQYGDSYFDASYAKRARDYALRASDAIDALKGTQVGLMVQGTDGGSQYSFWIDNMIAAVPNLGERVSAWTVHTYAPDWKGEMERTIRQLAAAGTPATVPFAVTETGYASDGGRCLDDNYANDPCMSYDGAAAKLTAKIAAMRATYGPRIESIMLYMERDLRNPGQVSGRESYFGLLKWDGSDKGAYTAAARDLFAGKGAAA